MNRPVANRGKVGVRGKATNRGQGMARGKVSVIPQNPLLKMDKLTMFNS
jgi:hypothetical protein